MIGFTVFYVTSDHRTVRGARVRASEIDQAAARGIRLAGPDEFVAGVIQSDFDHIVAEALTEQFQPGVDPGQFSLRV